MSFIDKSYFIGPLTIANTHTEEVSLRLSDFIEVYERQFFRELLGRDLYEEFEAATEGYPGSSGSPLTVETRWRELIEGATYEINGKTTRFRGLIDTTSRIPRSPIAGYVYFYWCRDAYTQTVGIGEVKSKSENSSPASPIFKQVAAWNEAVEEVWAAQRFLKARGSVYGFGGPYELIEPYCNDEDLEFDRYPYGSTRAKTFNRINAFGI